MNFVYANENHSTIINEKNGVVFITSQACKGRNMSWFFYKNRWSE